MIKKMIALVALLTLLAACTNEEEAARDKEIIENVKKSSQSDNSQEQVKESAAIAETASFPEYQTIIEEITNENQVFKLAADNEGKRIFFLMNEIGEEQYKTIFIKETSRLKIIDLESNSEIFNDKI